MNTLVSARTSRRTRIWGGARQVRGARCFGLARVAFAFFAFLLGCVWCWAGEDSRAWAASSLKADDQAKLLVVGVSGLGWQDLEDSGQPYESLRAAAQRGGVGNISHYAHARLTCPLDGWLTLAAGLPVNATSERSAGTCTPIPLPQAQTGVDSLQAVQAQLPAAWQDWSRVLLQQTGSSLLMSVGSALADANISVGAIGPGAAILAADAQGKIAHYMPWPQNQGASSADPDSSSAGSSDRAQAFSLEKVVRASLQRYQVTFLDLGSAADPALMQVPGQRLSASASDGLADFDRVHLPGREKLFAQLSRVLNAAGEHTNVLILGLADATNLSHLGLGLATGPAFASSGPGWLYTAGARQSGYLPLLNFTPLITQLVNAPLRNASALPGVAPVVQHSSLSVGELIESLQASSVRSEVTRVVLVPFYILFGLGIFFTFWVCVAGVIRALRLRSRKLPWSAPDGSFTHPLRVLCLATTLFGPASFILYFVPSQWFLLRTSLPDPTDTWPPYAQVVALFLAAVVALTCLLSALILVLHKTLIKVSGTYRRYFSRTGYAVFTCGLLWLWLLTSLLLGSPDQVGGVFASPAMSASRFFGLNNNKFAYLLAASCLLITLLGAALKRTRVSNWLLWPLALVFAVLVVGLDGLDSWGADAGGPFALGSALAVALFLASGGRSVWLGGLFSLLAGALALFGVGAWDYASGRGAHFNKFLHQLGSQEALVLVRRKFMQMVGTFGGNVFFAGFAIALIVMLLFWLVWSMKRPTQYPNIKAYYALPERELNFWAPWPGLLGGVIAAVVGTVISTPTNDTGTVILACVANLLFALLGTALFTPSAAKN